MTNKDFELRMLLLGWQVYAHDINVMKWVQNGAVLVRRRVVASIAPFTFYRSGPEISSSRMIASSVEFDNIDDVMAFLEERA